MLHCIMSHDSLMHNMHIACTRTVYIVYMYHMCMCTLVHMYSGRNKIQKFVGHFLSVTDYCAVENVQ